MKANEAPEKIILSADRETGILYDEWVIRDLTDNIKIEYIRTDAFIEKAVDWLKHSLDNGCWIANDVGKQEKDVIIEHFKETMKLKE